MNCLFCKIIAGEIPSTKVYEDDKILAFLDINPAAPVHILVVPKEHINSAADINAENSAVISHIFETIAKLAHEKGVAEKGFRVVTNIGKQGGQTVEHLHFHIIGGRQLSMAIA